MTIRLVIPEKARTLRRVLDFTCKDIGDKCGRTKQSISNFETKYASMDDAQLLANRILYTVGLSRCLAEDGRDKVVNAQEFWEMFTEEV